MKKLSIFVVLVLFVSMFQACDEETTNLLLGKWGWVSATYTEYEDGVQVDTGTVEEAFFTTVEILKGGTGTVTFLDLSYDTFNWKKDGKTLIIDEGTVDEQNQSIKTLTKLSLVLEMTETETEGDVVYTYVTTITMVKIP